MDVVYTYPFAMSESDDFDIGMNVDVRADLGPDVNVDDADINIHDWLGYMPDDVAVEIELFGDADADADDGGDAGSGSNINTAMPGTSPPANIGEDLASILYSYTSVMADYQENMNLYQRNMGIALGGRPPVAAPSPMRNHVRHTFSARRAAPPAPLDLSAFVDVAAYTGAPEGEDPATCPISMDVFGAGDAVATIRGCGHTFKSAALNEWFARGNAECPICRGDVRGAAAPARVPEPPVAPDQSRATAQILQAVVRGIARSMAAPAR
jgi:hypothetical protein